MKLSVQDELFLLGLLADIEIGESLLRFRPKHLRMLIDKALDDRDEASFMALTEQLNRWPIKFK